MRPQDTPKALTKFAIFTVASILVSVLIVGTLITGVSGRMVQYKALFTNAQMVFQGDAVRIAGVKVGSVDSVRLKGALAEVTFSVQDTQSVLNSTQVAIRYENLLGRRFLALTQGTGDTGRQRPDATIPVARTQEAVDLSTVLNGLRPIFNVMNPGMVNELDQAILHILQGDTGENLSELIKRMADFTGQLADHGEALVQSIDMTARVVDIVSAHRAELDTALTSFHTIATGLAAERREIGGAIDALTGLTEAAGTLLREAEPYLAPDFDRVGKAAKILADDKEIFDTALKNFAAILDTGTRIGGYGSWINLYTCRVYYQTGEPAGKTILLGPDVNSQACAGSINTEKPPISDSKPGGEQ